MLGPNDSVNIYEYVFLVAFPAPHIRGHFDKVSVNYFIKKYIAFKFPQLISYGMLD